MHIAVPLSRNNFPTLACHFCLFLLFATICDLSLSKYTTENSCNMYYFWTISCSLEISEFVVVPIPLRFFYAYLSCFSFLFYFSPFGGFSPFRRFDMLLRSRDVEQWMRYRNLPEELRRYWYSITNWCKFLLVDHITFVLQNFSLWHHYFARHASAYIMEICSFNFHSVLWQQCWQNSQSIHALIVKF